MPPCVVTACLLTAPRLRRCVRGPRWQHLHMPRRRQGNQRRQQRRQRKGGRQGARALRPVSTGARTLRLTLHVLMSNRQCGECTVLCPSCLQPPYACVLTVGCIRSQVPPRERRLLLRQSLLGAARWLRGTRGFHLCCQLLQQRRPARRHAGESRPVGPHGHDR